MEDPFKKYTKEYDRWYERNRFAYLSEIGALRKAVPKKGKGLEIGVGTGRFAQPLKIGWGIDPADKMLAIARRRGIKAIKGRGENLLFEDEEFDFVLIVITLGFIASPGKVVAETKRVLKDKGKIIIGIVDKDSHLGETYQEKKLAGHRFYKQANFYSAKEVIELLESHRFKKVVTFQTLFRPLEKIKRVEHPREGFGQGGFVVICGTKTKVKMEPRI